MKIRNIELSRIFGLCGILAPVVGLSSIFIAIYLVPWFSWTDNYLSDLGGNPGSDCLWSTWGSASVVFNFGLVTAGVLGILFGIGYKLSGLVSGIFGNLGALFIILDSCALIGVGLFTESTGTWHTLFSIAFFVLVGIALLFSTVAFFKAKEKKLALLSLILLIFGLTAIPLFITPKPVGSNAIAEMIPILAVAVFSFVIGFQIFMKRSEEGEEEKSQN
jgi:hypothetical membrane protein